MGGPVACVDPRFGDAEVDRMPRGESREGRLEDDGVVIKGKRRPAGMEESRGDAIVDIA